MTNKMFFLILQFTIILLYDQCNCTNNIINGYYWRDFNRKVPKDAVPGGSSVKGQTTYIGQSIHDESIVVGELYDNDPTLYYTFKRQPKTTIIWIKILCSNQLQYFVWAEATPSTVRFLGIKHVVSGGFNEEGFLYIGRADYESQKKVGSIIGPYDSNKDSTMVIRTSNTAVYYTFKSFEILLFNPPVSIASTCVPDEPVTECYSQLRRKEESNLQLVTLE